MVNASGAVVWCYKDEKWIPLQLSLVRLHGELTADHKLAISEFLQRIANKQLILQEDGFVELTEKHKELLRLQHNRQLDDNKRNNCETLERKISLGQIPEDKIVEQPRRPSMPELRSINHNNNINNKENLFINNLLKEETEKQKIKTDIINNENDEIVLRLLKKYCKYSKDALDNDIVNAIERIPDEEIKIRSRKLSYIPKEEKLYENVNESVLDVIEDNRNEHVIRWLKQQNGQNYFNDLSLLPTRRHSSVELKISSPTDSRKSSIFEQKSLESGFESRKNSLTTTQSTPSTPESRKSSWCELNSRKSSVGSNSSCSECDDSLSIDNNCNSIQWKKFLKKHLSAKNSERRLKKQWEAWSRNRRKLSLPFESHWNDLDAQP